MPRKVRNPGSGKPPHNGPAKGFINRPPRGVGIGGPAKPKTAPLSLVKPGEVRNPEGWNGVTKISPKSEAAEEAAQWAFGRDVAILMGEDELPLRRDDAAMRIMNRVWGTPKASVDVGGKDGAPLFPSLAVTIKSGGQ